MRKVNIKRSFWLLNDERREKIKETRAEISKLQYQLWQLKENCMHEIVQRYDSAVCSVCEEDFGWYCPDSPNHICDYSGEYGDDECIYCGEPEERK